MTKDRLAHDLEVADHRWRDAKGYTGRPVRKRSYWLAVAEHLFATGWNHKTAFQADRRRAEEFQRKAEEEALNTFLDLSARANDAEAKLAEIKAFHAKFRKGGYMESKLAAILYPPQGQP